MFIVDASLVKSKSCFPMQTTHLRFHLAESNGLVLGKEECFKAADNPQRFTIAACHAKSV